jgi:tryptophan-rich sensory protein
MGSLLALGAAIGAPLALGQVMGVLYAPDIVTWDQNLEKPSWKPPAVAFPIIWSSLYFLMGAASHRAWLSGAGTGTLGLYALQLGLNLAWKSLFFKAYNLKLASYDITALLGGVAVTTYQFLFLSYFLVFCAPTARRSLSSFDLDSTLFCNHLFSISTSFSIEVPLRRPSSRTPALHLASNSQPHGVILTGCLLNLQFHCQMHLYLA